MGAIDVKEVQAKIKELLEAVERGETVEITRDGRKLAFIAPAATGVGRKLPDLTEFRASLKVLKPCLTNSVVEMRNQERY